MPVVSQINISTPFIITKNTHKSHVRFYCNGNIRQILLFFSRVRDNIPHIPIYPSHIF